MKIHTMTQRSPEWYAIRNGKITMSRAKDLLTGGKGITRASYLREVAAEILAGPQPPGYQSNDMLRGIELEPYAVEAIEALLGIETQPAGFVTHDDERIGFSPDRLGDGLVVEIKCPQPKHHLRYREPGVAAAEHGPQIQGALWICSATSGLFASFCPWITERPLIVHRIARDEKVIAALSESALRGADEVAEMVEQVRANAMENPRVSAIAREAAQYWKQFNEALDEGVNLSE
jgi:hypothetical protein